MYLNIPSCLLLLQIAPKEDELRAFQSYSGTFEELSPPEQFLYIMASVPRLTNKINILILIHQFEVRHTVPSQAACPPSASQGSPSTLRLGSAYQVQQDGAFALQDSVQAAAASTDS